MTDIVIFGAERAAEVAKVYIDAHGPDRVVGFTVDQAFLKSDTLQGLPVVAWERLESCFPPAQVKLLGPVSYRRLNELRKVRHLEGKQRGYGFASFIHPASLVYASDIGENCLILEGNVIQPFAWIGKGVIIWSGSIIGHHAVIGDYCFLSSQVGVGAGARLGERCFLGGKVGVDPGVQIGEASFLSSGANVKGDLPAESLVRAHRDYATGHSSSLIRRLPGFR